MNLDGTALTDVTNSRYLNEEECVCAERHQDSLP
jgi:hypothetical protein